MISQTHLIVHISPEEVPGSEEYTRTLAVTGEVAHKLMNWEAIHSKGLEHVDGKDWEVFNCSKRGTHNGKPYVWGMFLEGLGAFNVMVPLENTRHLSEEERQYYSGRRMQMVGSHTGMVSYEFKSAEIPKEDL